MPEFLQKLTTKASELWGQFSTKQKVMMAVSVVVTLVVVLGVLSWATRPNYMVLFSNLDPKDAATIVERLKADKVPYKLRDGGTTILVPAKRVYDLRLELAGQGLPMMGTVGYEIFDRNNIGVTDFVQKLNYRRALEGELARTIRALAEVSSARVHVVIPERSLYATQQRKPSASIMLKLKPGARLSTSQVRGIANLVASSVEGLNPDNVTIVDSYGNALSEPKQAQSLASLTASQLQLQQEVEDYLTRKLNTLLEGVVGADKASVRVSALLDFNQLERTIEKYDSENPAIRSQETYSQPATGKGGTGGETTVTNYELNRTVERVVQAAGSIKRLSVAVVVDGHYKKVKGKDGKVETQFVPRSPEELAQLRKLVESAVGFDPKRGDQIEVTSLPFRSQEEESDELRRMERQQFWMKMVEKVALGLALLLFLGLLRSGLRSVQTVVTRQIEAPRGTTELRGPELPELEPEVVERVNKRRQVALFARQKPEDASRLVRTWLLERQESVEA